MDIYNLKVRTNNRNDTALGINPITYMGITNLLQVEESLFDDVNKKLINTVVSIVDDDVRIKKDQLDELTALESAKVINEQAIADAKAVTQRTIIALQTVTNNYLIVVDRYIKDVQALLMDAREYALSIQKKEVALGLLRAEVAEEKADVKIAELDMRIDLETINRKFVEIDVLKAELGVAKANVRLIMTQIEIEEAELREIQARVDVAMMAVEKVTLESDIALIFADISTRQLTKTRYDVENAEIQATYAWIADKLQSVLDILGVRQSQLIAKINTQKTLKTDATSLYNAQKDYVDLQYEEAQSDASVQNYKESATASVLSSEAALKAALLAASLTYNSTKTTGAVDVDGATKEAEKIETVSESKAKTTTDSHGVHKSEITQWIN